MVKYWKLLGEYNAETKTFSACAGTPASPFTPDTAGRLVGLRTVPSADAATTLIEHVQFRLTCTLWTPNQIECGAQGKGLNTAPNVSDGPALDWAINQPVDASHPITVEARNTTADTPVGVTVFLYGAFE